MSDLADRMACAIVKYGPLSGSQLSLRVETRKASVISELHANDRFECLGKGRGSKWRLAGNREHGHREPLGTDSGGGPCETLADRVAALERRVAELEAHAGAPA